jgi:hypothetical protein
MTELANTYLPETVSVTCREAEQVQVWRVESKDGRREEETFIIRVSGNEEDTCCIVGEGAVSVGFEWLSEESSDEDRKKWKKNKEHKTAKFGIANLLFIYFGANRSFLLRNGSEGEYEVMNSRAQLALKQRHSPESTKYIKRTTIARFYARRLERGREGREEREGRGKKVNEDDEKKRRKEVVQWPGWGLSWAARSTGCCLM